MRTRMFVPLLVALVATGCDPQPATDRLVVTPKIAPSTNQVEKVEQFTITSQGTFNAGYDNSAREIFILKDNKTGAEYIGITDCTLIRRVKAKEEAVSDAVDTALDVVDAALE